MWVTVNPDQLALSDFYAHSALIKLNNILPDSASG